MRFDESELEAKGFVRLPSGEWVKKPRVDRVPDRAAKIPTGDAKPDERKPLERRAQRAEQSRPRTARRARISFVFYAVRPADWDGFTIKELQDLCCHAGLLDGDAWDQLECDGIRSEKVHSPEDEKTEIVIKTTRTPL